MVTGWREQKYTSLTGDKFLIKSRDRFEPSDPAVGGICFFAVYMAASAAHGPSCQQKALCTFRVIVSELLWMNYKTKGLHDLLEETAIQVGFLYPRQELDKPKSPAHTREIKDINDVLKRLTDDDRRALENGTPKVGREKSVALATRRSDLLRFGILKETLGTQLAGRDSPATVKELCTSDYVWAEADELKATVRFLSGEHANVDSEGRLTVTEKGRQHYDKLDQQRPWEEPSPKEHIGF